MALLKGKRADTVSPATKPSEYTYFHFLRVAAAFAVVMIHVVAKDFNVPDVTSFQWQCFNAFEVITRWSVPVFIMISGALFLDNSRPMPLKKLFGKYILRIATAIIFWSAVFAVLYQGIYMHGSLSSVFEKMLQGPDHLWFLYMLIGLYLAVPLLRCITASEQSTRYFLLLNVIFVYLIPELFGSTILADIFQRMDFHMVLGYTGYFVAGYWLNSVEISKPCRIIIYIAGASGVIFAGVFSSVSSIQSGAPVMTFYQYLSWPIMLSGVAAFVMARYALANIQVSAMMRMLSNYSFGIYLMHQIFIDALRRFLGLSTLSWNALISVPVITVLSFILSALATAVVLRIPVLKRYVV